MNREIIASENAPAAVGPYSQAVKIGNLVYTAGQIALDPATGKLITGDTPEETITIQTRQVLNNLSAVLEAAGTSLSNVIKTTVFLRSIKEYGAMNEVYAEFFPEAPPARSAFAVAALPLAARVEIEVVALVPEAAEAPSAGPAEEQATEEAGEQHDTESITSMLDDAITSIESAVATGLRELSSFFADLQAQVEVEVEEDDDDDDDDDEKEEKKDKKKKDKKKKDKKGKKKKKE